MPNVEQLSAGEQFDDNTGLELGEGYLTFQSSAGNRIVFNVAVIRWMTTATWQALIGLQKLKGGF